MNDDVSGAERRHSYCRSGFWITTICIPKDNEVAFPAFIEGDSGLTYLWDVTMIVSRSNVQLARRHAPQIMSAENELYRMLGQWEDPLITEALIVLEQGSSPTLPQVVNICFRNFFGMVIGVFVDREVEKDTFDCINANGETFLMHLERIRSSAAVTRDDVQARRITLNLVDQGLIVKPSGNEISGRLLTHR